MLGSKRVDAVLDLITLFLEFCYLLVAGDHFLDVTLIEFMGRHVCLDGVGGAFRRLWNGWPLRLTLFNSVLLVKVFQGLFFLYQGSLFLRGIRFKGSLSGVVLSSTWLA